MTRIWATIDKLLAYMHHIVDWLETDVIEDVVVLKLKERVVGAVLTSS